MNSSNKIKNFILDNIKFHQKDIIQTAINRFGVSRQAIHKHMNSLIYDKKVVGYGTTKGRYYKLIPEVNYYKSINVDSKFDVQKIFDLYVQPHIKSLPSNITEIFEFSIFGLLNNLKDHSEATKLYFKIYIDHKEAHFIINDNGIGILKHIKKGLNLTNIEQAALELVKGSVSINCDKYSGEELNAIVHLFDIAIIDSCRKSMVFTAKKGNWELKPSMQGNGTKIHLKIAVSSKNSCADTFDTLFNSNDIIIRIPVNFLNLSKNKIINSRSLAKNLLKNVKNYKKIQFDFLNIDLIGPAFANALINISIENNKQAEIKWLNMNETIDLLMSRALERKL